MNNPVSLSETLVFKDLILKHTFLFVPEFYGPKSISPRKAPPPPPFRTKKKKFTKRMRQSSSKMHDKRLV